MLLKIRACLGTRSLSGKLLWKPTSRGFHHAASAKARSVWKPVPFISLSPSLRTRPISGHPLVARRCASSYTPGRSNSQRSIRTVTFGLIGINIAVFATWQYANFKNPDFKAWLIQNMTLNLDNIKNGRYWTLLTAAFSHLGFGHLLFNMVSLHAFGSILASMPGVRVAHVLSVAIGSAIAGSTAWLYQQLSQLRSQRHPLSSVSPRQRSQAIAVGASGMVMGIGAAATCLAPFSPMLLAFMPFVPIPLFVITGAYFALDAYALDRSDQIGHSAHLGGSIFGSLFYLLYMRRLGGVWTLLMRGGLRR